MSALDKFRLEGRRAIVTGASRGLGKAMAQTLSDAGAEVILVGRDRDSLGEAQEEISASGNRVHVLVADLESPQATERMCNEALQWFAPIDILVNNVGGRRVNIATEEMPLADWHRLLDLNLTSVFLCTKVLGGAMLSRGWGRVVNIASMCGNVATKAIFGRHYEAAKAAVVGFTRAVAADWAPHGITVNAIAPGPFMTEANRRWFREKPGFQHDIEAMIPMGRLGEPEEIGPLALYLASDASSYMTGAVVYIDGGYTLW